MAHRHCCVTGCKNGHYRIKKWKEEICDIHLDYKGGGLCVCDPPFILYAFPSQKTQSERRKNLSLPYSAIDGAGARRAFCPPCPLCDP